MRYDRGRRLYLEFRKVIRRIDVSMGPRLLKSGFNDVTAARNGAREFTGKLGVADSARFCSGHSGFKVHGSVFRPRQPTESQKIGHCPRGRQSLRRPYRRYESKRPGKGAARLHDPDPRLDQTFFERLRSPRAARPRPSNPSVPGSATSPGRGGADPT